MQKKDFSILFANIPPIGLGLYVENKILNYLNFIIIKNSKSNFKALVAKMETLKETQQGKLKGGFAIAIQQ